MRGKTGRVPRGNRHVDHVRRRRLDRETQRRQPVGEFRGVGVVLGQPRDMMFERIQAGGGEHAAWRMPPPSTLRQRRAPAIRPRPSSTDPAGAPSPLDRQTDTESNPSHRVALRVPEPDDRIVEPRPVEMGRESAGVRECGHLGK